MLNWIWLAFILIAVLFGGFTGQLPEMTKGAFEAAEVAVMKIALPLVGIWAIWLGVMRLAEASGFVQVLARGLRPIMRVLFPEVPPEHPAIGAMVLNMAANMLGLGNAATPLGLRAMAQLERLNPRPGVATNAMCTFLALNTASIQLIPTTAIGILLVAGAKDPFAIIPTAFLATVVAACSGVIAAKVLQELPFFRVTTPPPVPGSATAPTATPMSPTSTAPVDEPLPIDLPRMSGRARAVIGVYLGLMVAMGLNLVWPFLPWAPPVPPTAGGAQPGTVVRLVQAISTLAIPFLLSFFPLYAACRGIKVYEQFVEGAKEAFGTAQRVIPYLVAMLVSIALLRKAGVLDLVTNKLRPLFDWVHFPPDLLPMVLMRPLSGSGTQGLFVELVKNPVLGGPDSFPVRLAGTIYGSTETTFYVLAVYFGAVAIRQTRHALAVGLIADGVAVVASVAICRLMFG